MTSTWTDEDRLRGDEQTAEARLRRVNAAIQLRAAAFSEAAAVNKDGWPRHSDQERAELESAADQTFTQLVEEERAELAGAIAKVDQAIADVGAPLVGVDTETLARVTTLRTAIRLEVQRSTPDELERAAGAAIRAGDRVLARVWSEEINEHVRESTLAPADVARLSQIARSIRDQSENPEDARKRKSLQRRRDALEAHRKAFLEATHATDVEINRRALAATGQYAPL